MRIHVKADSFSVITKDSKKTVKARMDHEGRYLVRATELVRVGYPDFGQYGGTEFTFFPSEVIIPKKKVK